jgi:chain length determinant protein tyrosine kinase EpsG
MGALLLQTGKVSNSQLSAIVSLQAKEGLRFGEAAIKLGLVSKDDIKAILSRQFAYPTINSQNTRLSRTLTAAFQPDSATAEGLRTLRSELILRFFNSSDQKALALIGTEDAHCIAYTSANLAISFAQSGVRTLLIDANLREPQVHGWFGIDSRQSGLSDLLAERVNAQPISVAELGPLWVLPAGTQAPNPQELLSSRRYQELLQPLCHAFDMVLISTAPFSATSDAQIVAAQTGAALLVIREHQTRLIDLAKLSESLKALGVRLLGAALRQSDTDKWFGQARWFKSKRS